MVARTWLEIDLWFVSNLMLLLCKGRQWWYNHNCGSTQQKQKEQVPRYCVSWVGLSIFATDYCSKACTSNISRPTWNFAIQAQSPGTARDTEALEKIQPRAIGMVSGLASDVYESECRNWAWPRHKSAMLQVFKILHGHDHVTADHLFTLATHSENGVRQATGVLNLIKLRTHLEMRCTVTSSRSKWWTNGTSYLMTLRWPEARHTLWGFKIPQEQPKIEDNWRQKRCDVHP